MDWGKIISKLVQSGWTQERLARECGCTQPTISSISESLYRGSLQANRVLTLIGAKLCELAYAKRQKRREGNGADQNN